MHNQILNKSVYGPCVKTTILWSGYLSIQDICRMPFARRNTMYQLLINNIVLRGWNVAPLMVLTGSNAQRFGL